MNDEWRTPAYLFKYAEIMIPRGFDIDLAASEENTLCFEYFSKENSALDHEWHHYGSYGWCNPPYSNIGPWISKAINERLRGFTTIMLLPSPNGERWNMNLQSANDIIFIVGRVSFLNREGIPVQGNRQGSILVKYSNLPLGSANVYFVNRDRLMGKVKDEQRT